MNKQEIRLHRLDGDRQALSLFLLADATALAKEIFGSDPINQAILAAEIAAAVILSLCYLFLTLKYFRMEKEADRKDKEDI